MRYLILACLFSLTFRTGLIAQSNIDSLDQTLNEVANQGHIPGFAVAVLNKDQILYQKTFGYADLANQKEYSHKTIQNIGSVSKTLIGVSIMMLVEEGKLSLETPINDILPFKIIHPRFPDIPITVEHLATHSSGIDAENLEALTYIFENPQELELDRLSKSMQKEIKPLLNNEAMPMEQFIQEVLVEGGKWYKKKNFGKYAPGTHYVYSNIGAAVAGYVVELVSGEKFYEFTQKRILVPLGMYASGWNAGQADMDQHATTYLSGNVPVPMYWLITYPDGGLRTNIENLSAYLQEMIKGYAGESKLLSKESFQKMMGVRLDSEEQKQGLFWEIGKSGSIGHTGGDPGIIALIAFDPETLTGRVFMANIMPEGNGEDLKAILKVINAIKG